MMKEKDVAKVPLDAVPSKLMTVQELSEYLHVHKSTIYRMLRQREFPGFRIGSDWRFNIEAVDRWVQSKAHTSISFRDRLNGGMPNAASAGVVGCATPSDPATMRDCATRRTQNCTILDDAQAKALRVRIYFLCSECANLIDLAEGNLPRRHVEGSDMIRHAVEEHSLWLESIIE